VVDAAGNTFDEYAVTTDSLIDVLETRIVALEAIIARRGLGGLLAAWRLGRALRASVRPFEGASFEERRHEAVSVEWGARQSPQTAESQGCLNRSDAATDDRP
jgi:hypothetical protein